MTGPRKNTLAQCLRTQGGLDFEEALSRADANVESQRVRVLAHIEARLNALGRAIAAVEDEPRESDRRDLHRLSNDILSVAGLYDRRALGLAAYSLCDLLADLEMRGGWDAAAVRVHYDAMRILRAPELVPEAAQMELLDGLHKVCARR